MKTQDLEKLLAETGVPCITMILPMHQALSDKTKEPKVATETKKILKQKYLKTNPKVQSLIDKIDELVGQIEYSNLFEGIGLYISSNIAKLLYFHFPVDEKIRIKNVFDSRELLYYFDTTIDCSVLSISKNHIHLFNMVDEKLKEIKNKDFPINYVESYEYEKPSRGTSFGSNTLKEFERDKSVLQEIRLVDFLKSADQLLDKYLTNNTPLIISGGRKEIADFMEITRHKKRIIGKVLGNYNFDGNTKLAGLSLVQIKSYLKKENKNLITHLHELTGNNLVSSGLKQVWKDATEGKGLMLIVEKDFDKPGYISTDGYDLKLHKTVGNKKYIHENDVVERIIKMVREKKGKIKFVENGDMIDFDKIALQLRYNTN